MPCNTLGISMGFISRLFYSFFMTFFVCILSGCGARSQRIAPLVTTNHLQEYIMLVEGVECKFCAQTVLDIVKNIPGVSLARYHTTDDTYQESYITYLFDERISAIEEEQLNAALLKEGFSLKSIRPSYWAPIAHS